MIYADPAKPYFCLEPQTNAVGAFNRMGQGYDDKLGVIVLEPGASREGSMSFVPFDL
jgi:aldose 1-epimerase